MVITILVDGITHCYSIYGHKQLIQRHGIATWGTSHRHLGDWELDVLRTSVHPHGAHWFFGICLHVMWLKMTCCMYYICIYVRTYVYAMLYVHTHTHTCTQIR